ncbi:hypothetical protein CHLRE_08g384900v5 [Chlamydomonas reinhardtii]|uniref:Protein kinase domain-containing protein n=1 Tax=Chlamydomonas reinhardtii TaxID=3055 RepID=A0A2K3DIA9_CHLRE|nr:uncharacterized protein CHLRE_08g384900v5 [Chlamydomonas reinhardtii]PNW80273.1 hypothetical protein CHLRE_08g384900v5 [Chlamydomonas reinhardtii]
MSLNASLGGLKIKDPEEIERLIKENNDLKSQIAGGGASSSYQIPYEDLEVQDQIGGGGFSLVYRGFWKGTPVAIKKWFDPNHSDQMVQEFREEVMTLADLRHPNVMQFLGACMKLPHLAMVTEHMPFSLHHVLYQAGVDLDRKKLVGLAQDMARAFIYLHSRKPAIVHRDIKPANFLVDRAWKVKVCDFGLASNSKAQAGAGTPQYMAPELWENKHYNEKVDVYAFGVMLNEMIAKEPPFNGVPLLEVRQAVLDGKRPDIPLSCPKVLSDVIKKCWDASSEARPSFVQILDALKTAAQSV